MSRILILGGKGVIGTSLKKQLEERGHEVWTGGRSHSDSKCHYRLDIAERRQVEAAIRLINPYTIYNCAAEFGRWNGEAYYEQLWRTNVIGTRNVLEIAQRFDIPLIHFSSSEVYGDYEEVMHETVMEDVPIRQMNDYAMTKWVNEQQIMNEFNNVVRVRLFNTYGPGEWYHSYRSVNCVFTYMLLHNKPVTLYTGHKRSSTYIEDCTHALANIYSNFIPGEVYNIGSDYIHTIEELADLIVKHTGADPSLVKTSQSEKRTTKIKIVDNSKAVKDLDFKTTVCLEQGVMNTVNWMREYYSV